MRPTDQEAAVIKKIIGNSQFPRRGGMLCPAGRRGKPRRQSGGQRSGGRHGGVRARGFIVFSTGKERKGKLV